MANPRLTLLTAILLVPLTLALTAPAGASDVLEEVIVTGTFADKSPPAQRLVRRGDNLLLRVTITNDSREAQQREREIHATLKAAIDKAARIKHLEISQVSRNGFVLPLQESNYKIDLTNGSRPDTSQADFRVKVAIPNDKVDGEALILQLKKFIADLKMTGRTLVVADSDVEVSIVNPSRYRAEVIQLMGKDIKAVTQALGDDYRVILTGVDRPVEWARAGSLNVSIFIPYNYVVVPTSLSSYSVFPEY